MPHDTVAGTGSRVSALSSLQHRHDQNPLDYRETHRARSSRLDSHGSKLILQAPLDVTSKAGSSLGHTVDRQVNTCRLQSRDLVWKTGAGRDHCVKTAAAQALDHVQVGAQLR